MYNAFIHTIEPKAQLVSNSKFLHPLNHSFDDTRLKLKVSFIWSPFVLNPMNNVFKQNKASKLNIYFIKPIYFIFTLNKNIILVICNIGYE